MPAQAGIQYAVMPRERIEVTEYWIIRRSLSSGGHSADPLADDDGSWYDARCSSWYRKAQRFAAAAHVDGGKAGRGETAGTAVALFVGLELGLARAKLGGAAPVQRPVLELEGTVLGIYSLGETENLLGLTGDVRMQAFAGIDAIPAAADHGLAVVGADGGHDLVRRVVAPGKPGRRGRLHRLDHGREEIRRLHDVGRQSAIPEERRQCGLCLRTVDAIDRPGIIACDRQEPLNTGKPGLFVIIFAVLGKIGHQIAVIGFRRVDLGERRGGLPTAARARRGYDEVVGRDAKRVAAALRDRR